MKHSKKRSLKTILSSFSLFILASIIMFSCKKTSTDVQTPYVPGGTTVQPGNISGSIKGTMESNQTYNVTGDVIINAGDSLIIQPGAKVVFQGTYNFFIKGNMFSLGSSASPVIFTFNNATKNGQSQVKPLLPILLM